LPYYSKEPFAIKGGAGGTDGKSLEYDWDGTSLGIRQEGEEDYDYVDLKGETGERGEQGIQGETGVAGADGSDGADGVDGNDGVGVANITFDSEENEFVFEMTDSSEIRVAMPITD